MRIPASGYKVESYQGRPLVSRTYTRVHLQMWEQYAYEKKKKTVKSVVWGFNN